MSSTKKVKARKHAVKKAAKARSRAAKKAKAPRRLSIMRPSRCARSRARC
jgi:hypothetical protein